MYIFLKPAWSSGRLSIQEAGFVASQLWSSCQGVLEAGRAGPSRSRRITSLGA